MLRNMAFFRPLCLCVMLLLSATATQADSFSADTVIFDWNILHLEVGGEQAATERGDQLKILPGGTFELQLFDTTRSEQGRWLVRQDSLVLQYQLLSMQHPIDSMVYEAVENKARLLLFSEGEQIAMQDGKGLESARFERTYAISFDERGNLSLSGADRSFQLYGRAKLLQDPFSFMDIVRGLFGLLAMLFIAWIFSTNRKAIDWRLVGTGMALQLIFAILVLKVTFVRVIFDALAKGFVSLLDFTRAGSDFLFSGLVSDTTTFGYIFAFQVLPTIVFFSALMSVLYYLGVLQRVVYGLAWVMSKTMRLSGAESLAAAGNIFLGQTEAPLLIKPYLEQMTRSEIMALMTGGMATIAGGVFAAYVGFLGGNDPVQTQQFAAHLLTASIMSAPAALVAAKILIPETETINPNLTVPRDRIGANVLDAISNGTTDGLKLAVNVGVMLLVFTALMALANGFFANVIGDYTGLNEWVFAFTEGRYGEFNLQFILGMVFAPIAWLLGVPAEDMLITGQLLGEKTILNEFFAYATLGTAKSVGSIVHYKSVIIATYALCGFANFASIGIQIGGIGALAPSKRKILSEVSIRALLGGTLAAFMTAAIAGMLISV